jgi:small subunit ribosomal protein S11
MSRSTRRLLAHSPFKSAIEAFSTRSSLQCLRSRSFSNTTHRQADEKAASPSPTPGSGPSQPAPKSNPLGDLASIFSKNQSQRNAKPGDSALSSFLDVTSLSSIGSPSLVQEDRFEEPHHLHIYATKHNTHITLTKPNRDPLISVSAGNIGFRKSARKHYDTAFQLAGYVMGRMQEQGINAQIKKLEVVLRGFGAGREAVTKALLGNEGRLLRGKVVKVSDSTRLKFGGTRSPKPRRLG